MIRCLVLCLALAGLMCMAVTGCDSKSTDSAQPSSSSAQAAPVPAPDGLAAELIINNPGRLWETIRAETPLIRVGTSRSLAGLAISGLGLPLQAIDQFDEQLPLLGAALDMDGARGFAFAIHVRDPARCRALFTGGEDAAFTAERVGDFTWFSPTEAARSSVFDAVIAMHDHYLVAGSDRRSVEVLAPYMSRTLAREEANADAQLRLRRAAFESVEDAELPTIDGLELPEFLTAVVDREALRGALRDALGGTESATVRFALEPERIVIDGTLQFRAALSDVMASLPTLERDELLDAPDDAIGTLAWTESEASRIDSATRLAKSFGAALGGSDTTLEAALLHLARGRGGRQHIGVRCTGIGLTVFAHGDVVDAGALKEGVSQLVALHKDPKVKAQLAQQKVDLQVKRTRVLEVPFDITRVRLTSQRTKLAASPVALVFAQHEKRYFITGGHEASATLPMIFAPNEETSWRRHPAIADPLARLGERLWFAAVVDATGIAACLEGQPGNAALTPLVIAVFPRGQPAFRLEVPRRALGLIR